MVEKQGLNEFAKECYEVCTYPNTTPWVSLSQAERNRWIMNANIITDKYPLSPTSQPPQEKSAALDLFKIESELNATQSFSKRQIQIILNTLKGSVSTFTQPVHCSDEYVTCFKCGNHIDTKYNANFLWGKEGGFETLMYEFANAKSEEYQKLMFDKIALLSQKTPAEVEGDEGGLRKALEDAYKQLKAIEHHVPYEMELKNIEQALGKRSGK